MMPNIHGDRDQMGEDLSSPSVFGMRRSCDTCGRKKRRCDGKQPCSRCVRSTSQCKYSKRRWHQPDQPEHRQQHHSNHSDRDTVRARRHQLHLTSGALARHRVLPFKRCRFRASPATGLVGLQENTFLSDFFGCVGFLPLASESEIRETMVKIMVLAAPRQEPALNTEFCVEEVQSGTVLGWGTFGNVSGRDKLAEDPSFATFWSAVALGGLAKGIPVEAVESYSQLAREALAVNRFGSTNAELAKASAILTYVYSCMNDMGKFREYLNLSEYFLQASIGQGSTDVQEGLRDVVLHYRKVANVQDGPMDSSWAHGEGFPQLEKIAAEGELYPFIAQSFRAFDEAVHAKARERCAGNLEHFYFSGPSHRKFCPDDRLPGEVSEAVAAVFETTNSLEFEPLEQTADRPSIRSGIGDLLINGPLVFGYAAKGDTDATLEKLDRSIRVYERYPGLCRCMMASHMPHMFLAVLADIGDQRARAMYDRLRGACDSCRPPHTLPLPPLDEWQGVTAICDDLHCRAMEAFIQGGCPKAFTTSSLDSGDGSTGPTQAAKIQDGQTPSAISAASVSHGQIVDLIYASPSCSWIGPNATSDCPRNQDPAGAVVCFGAALTPLVTQLHPSSQSGMGVANACVVNDVTTNCFHPFPRLAEIGTHHGDSAEQEHGEIAPADWLEVAHSMLGAVTPSGERQISGMSTSTT